MIATGPENLWTGRPLWLDKPAPVPAFSACAGDSRCDVAVVGAGITGAVVAEALAREGYDVALFDRRGPLRGSTIASTALLQAELDMPLQTMRRRLGIAAAEQAWRRSRLALDALAARIRMLDIDCGLQEKPVLYLPGNVLSRTQLQQEAVLRRAAGLGAAMADKALLHAGCIRADAALQTQSAFEVHPGRLLAGMLAAAAAQGARLYAPESVADIEAHPRHVLLQLESGARVRAGHVVFATGYEVLKGLRCRPYRLTSSWAFATAPQPRNIWWQGAQIWQAADPYLYIRTTNDGRVICGGEDEDMDDPARRATLMPAKVARLRRKLARLLPGIDTTPASCWAGCFGQTPRGLPMIGRVPGLPRCLAVMAFGGNGITFSQIGADMAANMIAGRPDSEEKLFSLV